MLVSSWSSPLRPVCLGSCESFRSVCLNGYRSLRSELQAVPTPGVTRVAVAVMPLAVLVVGFAVFVGVGAKNFAVDFPWWNSKWSVAQRLLCLSVSAVGPVRPFLVLRLFFLFFLPRTGCVFVSFGLKRALWASRMRCFSFAVTRFVVARFAGRVAFFLCVILVHVPVWVGSASSFH